MPRKNHIFVTLIMLVLCTFTAFAHSVKALTNKDIVTLVKGGLAPQTIVEMIKQSECKFDISPEAMIALKQDGVPDMVIHAMVAKNNPNSSPTSPDSSSPGTESFTAPSTGITMIDGSNQIPMKYSISSGGKTSGVGMKMVNPFGKIKIKQTLSGNQATLQTNNTSPTFELTVASNFNPIDNVFLIKFDVKSDRREISVASGRMSASSGFDKENLIPITLEESPAGKRGQTSVYKVTLKGPLAPGEYAFVLFMSTYYDFGVGGPK